MERQLFQILAVAVLLVGLTGGGTAVAAQQEPPEVSVYYGNVTQTDGVLAPENTTIVATTSNDTDTSDVDLPGTYGLSEGPLNKDPITLNYTANENVEFFVERGDGELLPANENPVVLENGSNQQNLTFDPDTFKTSFEVGISSAPNNVTAGDNVTVDYEVENNGTISGTQQITASFNGSQADTNTVSLASGETRGLTTEFTTDTDDVGTPNITIESANETLTQSVTVTEPGDPDYAVNITAVNESVLEGEKITINYEITNSGSGSGEKNINILVTPVRGTETTVSTETIALRSGETVTQAETYETQSIDTPWIDVAVSSENTTDTASKVCVGADVGPIGNSDNPPKDTTGDCLYNSIRGTDDPGTVDFSVLFDAIQTNDPVVVNNPEMFKFSSPGSDATVGTTDASQLFNNL